MSSLSKMQNTRMCLKVTKYEWPEVHVFDNDFQGCRMFSTSIDNAVTVLSCQLKDALKAMKEAKKEGLIINFTFMDSIPGSTRFDGDSNYTLFLFDD